MNPKEVIERIRREEYSVGVDLPPEATQATDALKRKLGNALRLLSEELYSTDTHFVLELLQNAEDNTYSPQIQTPQVSVYVNPESLVFTNNEIGFSEDDVLSLCSVGESKKTKSGGFIGEKGIGFKSVFTITDRPEIHSNGFSFCFDTRDPEDILGYIVPHCVDSVPECAPSHGTTLVLPAKPDRQFDISVLDELQPELLLFLKKLGRISIYNPSCDAEEHIRLDRDGQLLILSKEGSRYGGSDSGVESRSFLRSTFSADTSDIAERRREGIGVSEIVLAFPLQENAEADTSKSEKLFSFLPVREFGLRFVFHADFLLVSGRDDIVRSSPWNIRLRDSLVPAFISSVPIFKQEKMLQHSFYGYIPSSTEGLDGFLHPFVSAIHQELTQKDCILTAGDSWRRPKDVLLASHAIRELIPNNDLETLLCREYLSPRIKDHTALFETLGVQKFNADHLVQCLGHDSWVSAHADDWYSRLFVSLSRMKLTEKHLASLRACHLLRLANASNTALNEGPVFLPIEHDVRYGFEHEMRVLHEEALPRDEEKLQQVLAFLTRLGIEESTPAGVIDQHILPIFACDDWKRRPWELHHGYTAYVLDHLEAYLDDATNPTDAMKSLRKTVWIKTTRMADSGKHFYRHGSALYLGRDFGNKLGLEDLFEHGGEFDYYVSPDYLLSVGDSESPPGAPARNWRSFFTRLEVSMIPRVRRVTGSGFGSLDHISPPPVSHSPQHLDFVMSDELQVVSQSRAKSKVNKILSIIHNNWDSYYSDFLEAQLTSVYWKRNRQQTGPSSFLLGLRQMEVPVDDAWAELQSTYLDSPDMRAAFGDDVPYLKRRLKNESFLDNVLVTREVSVQSALKRLRQLSGEDARAIAIARKLYRNIEVRFDTDSDEIQAAFADEPLVYIPTQRKWVSTNTCIWASTTALVEKLHPSLERPYPDFTDFFVRNLGVLEHLSPTSLTDLLGELAEMEAPSTQLEHAAAFAYKELEWWLRHGDDNTRWPAVFQRNALLWTTKDEFWRDEGDIFVNDVPELAQLFDGCDSIAFLGVPPQDIPRLKAFIEATGLHYLSDSVDRRPIGIDEASLSEDLTSLVRSRWIDLAGYVYATDNPRYEALLEDGSLGRLAELEVFLVPHLQLEVRLNQDCASIAAEVVGTEAALYVDETSAPDVDAIALELAKTLGLTLEDSSFLTLLLSARSTKAIEGLFQHRHLPILPSVEIDRLTAGPGRPPAESLRTSALVDYEFGDAPAPEEKTQPEAESQKSPHIPGAPSSTAPDTTAGTPSVSSDQPPTGSDRHAVGGSPAPAPTHQKTPARPSTRSRDDWLISYVVGNATSSDFNAYSDGNDEVPEHIETGKAAVERVLEYERKRNRRPRSMSHSNPGFDVMSRNTSGELVRYIEVKGLSGPWGRSGVPLSPTQLTFGAQHREKFWLYVVEYAHDPDHAHVHAIPDPVGRVTQYRFDRGWKRAADAETPDANIPRRGMTVILDNGTEATIESVDGQEQGDLRNLHLRFADGSDATRIFNPATMRLQ